MNAGLAGGVEIRPSQRDFSFFNGIPAVETAGYFRVFLRNKGGGEVTYCRQ